MENCIHQLPDHIANQIAAGEVIQRPASVIKELVENAVDAGATKVTVNIKDAGKTLIQVVDNGKGMSETDSRMAFERHATSKISNAKDLFHLTTMGFRGEALASIAAISNVTLTTRTADNELGTQLQISGSDVVLHEPTQCQVGCNFQIKNLFFNVPARRKFLKSDSTEFRHINDEFTRVALTQPQICFELIHNGEIVHNLPSGNLKQRIVSVFGKNFNENLIPVETQTTLGRIYGFIGKTELARKSPGEQFFFVNNRFMRHPYFYKAVMMAYDQLLQKGQYPAFFIYFDVDPETIDVNIHPTKTEIKFENEAPLWQILQAAVKESIGKNNLTPSIDFNMENAIDIPVASAQREPARQPEIRVNPQYNPFEKENSYRRPDSFNLFSHKADNASWDSLYTEFDNTKTQQQYFEPSSNADIQITDKIAQPRFFQIKQRYIISQVKSGIMLIDQKRAHERIVFERLKHNINLQKSSTQATLFPDEFCPGNAEAQILREILPELQTLGFRISESDNIFYIEGVPGELSQVQPILLLEQLIAGLDEANPDIHETLIEIIASKLAQISSMNKVRLLTEEEMEHLTESLFTCQLPNYAPDGNPVLRILTIDEIERLLTN